MSNITIPNLPVAISLTGSELIEVVQGGVNKRTTVLAVGTGGLTLPLPIAQGGTGETTAPEAIEALLPAYAGNANKVLAVNATADGIEWDTISGAGDVVGPASATDNAVARFDLTTGKLIQNSLATIGDSGNISAPADAEFNGITVGRGANNGLFDTALGEDALATTGAPSTAANTAIGYKAGELLINPRNTVVGAAACSLNGGGVDNVIIGYQAYLTGDGRENVCIGSGAMASSFARGFSNVTIGYNTFGLASLGQSNVFIGANVAPLAINASYNVSVGRDSASFLVGGGYNVFVGNAAGPLTDLTGNICIGYNSGRLLTGNGNVVIGELNGPPGVSDTFFAGNGGVEWFRANVNGMTIVGTVQAASVTVPQASTLTIASGAITVTAGFHLVDTEGGAATDDLDTINGGVDGRILVLMAANGARDVVVKNNTGNIRCGSDFTMNTEFDTITLMYVNALTTWVQIARSDNA